MAAAADTRPSAHRTIPVRRLDVDMAAVGAADASSPGDDRRWIVPDDPIFSHFVVTLSAVFPRGEEFFVSTVREHRSAADDDPLLKAQVKAFAGQEAMHGREHRALNTRLGDQGYRTQRSDRAVGRRLDVIFRLKPRTLPLAVTAGSEHLTGILAEAVLGHDQTRATLLSDPQFSALLTWHALEELEHKNVAFDVLDRAGGGYLVRVAGLVIAVVVLGGCVVHEWAAAVAADRRHIGRRELRRFRANRRHQRLLSPWALRQLLRYLRPGFHPDDMDTDALVDVWRSRLADITTVTAGMRA